MNLGLTVNLELFICLFIWSFVRVQPVKAGESGKPPKHVALGMKPMPFSSRGRQMTEGSHVILPLSRHVHHWFFTNSSNKNPIVLKEFVPPFQNERKEMKGNHRRCCMHACSSLLALACWDLLCVCSVHITTKKKIKCS